MIRKFEGFSGGRYDAVITILEEPSWFDRLLGRRKRYVRYRGGSEGWRKYPSGVPAGDDTGQWLRVIARRELSD